MDLPVETTPVIRTNLAPMVLLVAGGQLAPGAGEALVDFMKRSSNGGRPGMLVIEATALISTDPAVPVTLKLQQLSHEATPVAFFIDYGTPESLIENCAQAAHEAARRAGDAVKPWDDLTMAELRPVLELTADILHGRLAGQQRAMREARGPLLECNPEPHEASAVPTSDRHRLAMLFYAVVELMRIEFDIIRSKGAADREGRSRPALPPARPGDVVPFLP